MQWQSLGFSEDPLSTEPILQDTLELFTGHKNELKMCLSVLSNKNVRIVIEGERGVGTTSFSNYLRFTQQQAGYYFTPRNEIKVGPGWQLETLLGVMVANIVREIELFGEAKLTKDKRFQNAQSLSSRIAETYRSFGVDAFGFGMNYGKNPGVVTQPIIVPSAVLGHHLEDLAELIRTNHHKKGILVQLNNLDIGEVQDEKHLKFLFNALRDYTQIRGVSWLFVGDIGLRRFIAQQVDRLDDIISYEAVIKPLSKTGFLELIKRRVESYRTTKKVQLPVDEDVLLYLHDITKGRLRYIFGLLSKLMDILQVGDLSDRVVLSVAKPMLAKIAKVRVERNDITEAERKILCEVVKNPGTTATDIAKKLKKSKQYIGKSLARFVNIRLLTMQKKGRSRYYYPEIDTTIAYGEDE